MQPNKVYDEVISAELRQTNRRPSKAIVRILPDCRVGHLLRLPKSITSISVKHGGSSRLRLDLDVAAAVRDVDERVGREAETLTADDLALIRRNTDVVRALEVGGKP